MAKSKLKKMTELGFLILDLHDKRIRSMIEDPHELYGPWPVLEVNGVKYRVTGGYARVEVEELPGQGLE